MSLGSQIAANLPFLRRYARALTGSQASGDAFVREMLEAVLADEALMASLAGGRVPLYRAFSKVWASASGPEATGTAASEHEAGAQARLARAQILQEAGTAMLVQANATTQNVMNLLRSS